MASSTKRGHIALNGIELILQEETYAKQLQTPFNPRFSTGDPGLGGLSFFQYIAMEDWSGGSGQEIFSVTNRFSDSENVDITKPGELKLSPLIEFVQNVNGPQQDQFNRPIEEEDSWPQLIEWIGGAVVYNDRHETDSGGVDFLDVFDTTIVGDQVIPNDTSGLSGIITNDDNATILSISKVQGLPGDVFIVSVKFTNPKVYIYDNSFFATVFGVSPAINHVNLDPIKIQFRIAFMPTASPTITSAPETNVVTVEQSFARILFADAGLGGAQPSQITLSHETIVDFTVRVPQLDPGIYYLTTFCRIGNAPFTYDPVSAAKPHNSYFSPTTLQTITIPYMNFGDTRCNATVPFYVQSATGIQVIRKSLYAPQLKAATIVGSDMVGGRVFDGKGYVEVYRHQNAGIDRILQLKLSDGNITPATPTYMQFIGSDNVVIAAFDTRIYKIDIQTVGLTVAQRFTFIGTVPGDYVSGMALWNQRIYILSFNKNEFTSVISWTNGTEIQGSYSIDGKFWGTDLANFNGALFYAGGNQDGVGKVKLYPSEDVIEVTHPVFDARVRTLNAGRFLYFGHSHGTGIGVITQNGASNFAAIDLRDRIQNVVWDIEEVGSDIYFLSGNSLYKTSPGKYPIDGFLETSEIGANTPLISKIWTSIVIEVRELTATQSIGLLARTSSDVEGQWSAIGDMVQGDGTQKEFVLPSSFQSQWIQLRLVLRTHNRSATPIIKRVLLKYIPSILNKLQWVFTVRATNGLKMLDGNYSQDSAEIIRNNLWLLRDSGVISFRDVDEVQYNVIVSDIREAVPLEDKGNPESLISFELLEV